MATHRIGDIKAWARKEIRARLKRRAFMTTSSFSACVLSIFAPFCVLVGVEGYEVTLIGVSDWICAPLPKKEDLKDLGRIVGMCGSVAEVNVEIMENDGGLKFTCKRLGKD